MSSLLKLKSTSQAQKEKNKERETVIKANKSQQQGQEQEQEQEHGYKGFFKRHFSLNKKHKNTPFLDENGSSTSAGASASTSASPVHSPRILSPMPRVPMPPPGPASPTVQHTDHIPTPLREKLYLDKGNGNTSNSKTKTKAKTITKPKDDKLIKPASPKGVLSLSPTNNIDSSHTLLRDLTPEENQKTTSNKKLTRTQSHTLQYEYFPTLPNSELEQGSKPVDPESGMLQGTEEIINKVVLQNVVQRNIEKKRGKSSEEDALSPYSSSSSSIASSASSLTSLTSEVYHRNSNSDGANGSSPVAVTVPTTAESKTETGKKPVSATAAIMMKLYQDNSQMEYERTRRDNLRNNGEHIDTEIKRKENSSEYFEAMEYGHYKEDGYVSHPSAPSSPVPYTGEINAPTTGLAGQNANYGLNSVSPTPSYTTSHSMSVSNSNSNSDSDSNSNMDMSDDETVQVILKWRDPLDNPSKTKIFLISEDIVSTLLASNSSITINIVDKRNFKMSMLFDYSSNEWFVPGLLLPPGIYRLQFLVNGVMTHSSFLPTATNSAGAIVNWFEVIPGYKRIEPFRDDTQIQSSNANDDGDGDRFDNNYDTKGRSSSASKALSSTSLTDYAGISRSDSVVGKSLLTSLKLTSLENDKPKLSYSNQIPEIFKFDPPENPDEQPKVAFSLTLPNVVDFNQDTLFANIQSAGKMSAEDAEAFFLNRFKVPNLPIYLNSTYLNKNFGNDQNYIIPHVNLNHLLTSSIRDDMVYVGCTTRYAGKFITQVMYYPCSIEASSPEQANAEDGA